MFACPVIMLRAAYRMMMFAMLKLRYMLMFMLILFVVDITIFYAIAFDAAHRAKPQPFISLSTLMPLSSVILCAYALCRRLTLLLIT